MNQLKFLLGVALFLGGSFYWFDGQIVLTSVSESKLFDSTDNFIKTKSSVRYELDAKQSQFMVHASRSGLLWFKGHNHLIKVEDFSGVAELTLNALNPASLQMQIRAESLHETSSVFTDPQKQIIDKELREIVLESAKYPEITFKSTGVTGKLINGQYEAQIKGDITLHGVTRSIIIPATISINGRDLRARGEFTINRSDFKVKATSAAHGLVRVRNKLKFTFDIVAHQI
jgi:polyisoprenoid-binding protein YceI